MDNLPNTFAGTTLSNQSIDTTSMPPSILQFIVDRIRPLLRDQVDDQLLGLYNKPNQSKWRDSMTATRTVEESRQDELDSKHWAYHDFRIIVSINLMTPCRYAQQNCIAPLVDLSIEVNHLKEKQQLEKKVANVEEQLEGAEAQLEAAQVAGVTTVQGQSLHVRRRGQEEMGCRARRCSRHIGKGQ